MTRLQSELSDADLELLAELTGTVAADLARELSRRPWYANDLLRHDAVVEFVMEGDGINQLRVSPLLFFAVLVNRAANDLASSDFVDDWVGSGCRLPVFDVEPLQEFTDAPGRLTFTTSLLTNFTMPTCGLRDRAARFTDVVRAAIRLPAYLTRQSGIRGAVTPLCA